MRTGGKLLLLIAMALFACTGAGTEGDLCQRTFEPYQDLISGQQRTPRNALYVDAMERYSAGDHAAAAEGLNRYLEQRGAVKSAHLYLACSYLALGRPYDAELEIDHLENSNLRDFKDQCEWYTVVCWLCSGQKDRALTGAEAIANAVRHTYKAQAQKLVDELSTDRR